MCLHCPCSDYLENCQTKIGPLTMLSHVMVTAHTRGGRVVKYSECCEFGAAGGDAKQR